MMRFPDRLLAVFSILAVCCLGPSFGLQQQAPSPPAPPPTLADSLERAFNLISARQFQQAKAELERATALAEGPCGECLLGLAHVYAADQEWGRVVDTLQQAIPLLSSPGDQARAYNQLGVALTKVKLGRSEAKAEEALRTAADLGGPWGRLARYNLAEVLLRRQRWAEAAEAARRYLNDTPPGAMAVKEARLVLCAARSHLPAESLPEQEQASEPIRVGGAVSRPEILFQTGPVYPEKARRAGASGLVIVEAIIDTEGCMTDIRVLQSLRPDLDGAAIEAVRRWVFAPARLDGKPVKVYYVLTVNFQIEG